MRTIHTKKRRAEDIRLTKDKIRSKILLKLKTQKEEERTRKSRVIQKKLFRSLWFKKAKKVMFYIAFGGEVETQEMIKKAQSLGKVITVPVCQKNRRMKPCILEEITALKKGLYGLMEPAIKKFVDLNSLDLVVVPAVAFDKKGNRLGRGRGYYDSFLKKLPKRTMSLGLAFDFQILPSLPTTAHDVSVQRIFSG